MVYFAYALVVLIWATTPLAIQWSSDQLNFAIAVCLRMSIAFVIGLMLALIFRRNILPHRGVWPVYLAGAFGIFPNMPVVYWAAQKIPSGVVAVIFALSPFFTGLFTWALMKENPFTARRCIALLLAFIGLCIIFLQEVTLGKEAFLGIIGVLLACCLFCLSSVIVKKWSGRVDPFNQMLGTLLYALPGLWLTWWVCDGVSPQFFSTKAVSSILYLAVFGSLVGATLFFFVLQRMSASAVSLITLVTPVLAIVIGTSVGGETLPVSVLFGSGIVILALLTYLDIYNCGWFFRALRRRNWVSSGSHRM